MKKVTEVIDSIRGGVFSNDLAAQFKSLVQRVQESGKKGVITIQLTLSPSGKDNRVMQVLPKATLKMPPAPETDDPGTFYAQFGELHRDDPNQRSLFVKEGAKEDGLVADGRSPAEQPVRAVAEREERASSGPVA